MGYKVKKDRKKYTIDYMEYDLPGYKFLPKNTSKDYLSVSNIVIYDEDMIKNILSKKFSRKFDSVAKIILNFLSQDDESADEGDFVILLDELERLRRVIDLKYKNYLEIKEYNEYVEKLIFLRRELANKLARINFKINIQNQLFKENLEYQEEMMNNRHL